MTTASSSSESTWSLIVRLLRWNKPAGRLILMIPALWAVCLAADGRPPLPLVGIIILGSLATSAAGCVINDLWDRDIDPLVERTQNRPLAARTLSIKTGIMIGAIALLCAAGFATYLNWLSFVLCVAAVPVIIGYPLAKRVFPVPQLLLSLAWGFAVLISWSAVTGELTQATALLWGATVLWTLGFDTIYALSDREDDRKIGINSSALFFGDFAADVVGLCFAGTATLLALLARTLGLVSWFWWGWAIALAGWGWQYWQLKQPDLAPHRYSQLFSQNVGLGVIILMGMLLGTLHG